MSRSLAFFVIGFLFGGAIGFLAATSNTVTLDGHDHGTHIHDDAGANHTAADQGATDHGTMSHDALLPVSPANAPDLSIAVTPDPMSGWNLKIETTDFRFAPENASKEHVAGEGHAHIYINGEKIARHYGHWFHIATLPPGENTIRVTLNANDHRPLAIADRPLESSIVINVD